MSGVELITPDVTQAAAYIATAWKQGVEAIIETGRRLIEKREQFKDERGKWSMLIGAHGYTPILPFGKTHAYRLIAIAECARLFPHAGTLPSDSTTLYHLTRLTDGRFTAMIEDGRIHPGMKRNEASAETRKESKERDEERVLSLHPANGTYRALVIDPPWDYEWLSLAGRAAPGYATMTQDELLALDVESWAEDDCHLYLWTTNNFIIRAGDLMAHWGFKHKTVLVWVKPRWGLGAYFRNTTELVLFGVRGELRTRSDSIATHFEAPTTDHSVKPDIFYDIVRQASYPPFGEVFQRGAHADFINLFEARGADADRG